MASPGDRRRPGRAGATTTSTSGSPSAASSRRSVVSTRMSIGRSLTTDGANSSSLRTNPSRTQPDLRSVRMLRTTLLAAARSPLCAGRRRGRAVRPAGRPLRRRHDVDEAVAAVPPAHGRPARHRRPPRRGHHRPRAGRGRIVAAYLTLLRAARRRGARRPGRGVGQAVRAGPEPAPGRREDRAGCRRGRSARRRPRSAPPSPSTWRTTPPPTRPCGTVRDLRVDFPWVGAVLQSQLRRTEADCRDLAGPGSRVRLCKGAYDEPASVAYRGSDEVDRRTSRCLKILMAGQGLPMVATHDPRLVDDRPHLAQRNGRGVDDYELQMLYGVRPRRPDRARRRGRAGARLPALRHRVVRLLHAPARRAAGEPRLLRRARCSPAADLSHPTRASRSPMSQATSRSAFLRRKPIDEVEPETGAVWNARSGCWQLTAIGVGGIIGAGIFSLAGAVANETAGPGRRHLVPGRGHRERRRRLLLRRVRRADPEGRLGLHLRLRGARRVRRLVHRLGPAAGVHRDRRGGRDRHLRLLQRSARLPRAGAAAVDARGAGHRARGRGAGHLPGRPVRRAAVPADRVRAEPGHEERRTVRDVAGLPQGRRRRCW